MRLSDDTKRLANEVVSPHRFEGDTSLRDTIIGSIAIILVIILRWKLDFHNDIFLMLFVGFGFWMISKSRLVDFLDLIARFSQDIFKRK